MAHLDKARPVLVLTREPVRAAMRRVTVAPITTTAKGLSTEVPVGPANGLDQDCVISCDNIITIDRDAIGRHVGFVRTPGARSHHGDRQRFRSAHR